MQPYPSHYYLSSLTLHTIFTLNIGKWRAPYPLRSRMNGNSKESRSYKLPSSSFSSPHPPSPRVFPSPHPHRVPSYFPYHSAHGFLLVISVPFTSCSESTSSPRYSLQNA